MDIPLNDYKARMLTTSWDYVEGVISRTGAVSDEADGTWTERFWHEAPDKWRLELSSDLTYVTDGEFAVVTVDGTIVDRGLPRIPINFSAETLLYPGRAALWTWPGDEGWSLADEVSYLADYVEVPLDYGEQRRGLLRVSMPKGYIKYLRQDAETFEITEIREERPRGAETQSLFDPTDLA